MRIAKRFEDWNFKRNLRIAKKRWAKMVSSSVYYKMGRWERRAFIKAALRDIGYKQIRIQERRKGLSAKGVAGLAEAVFDATDKSLKEEHI